MWLIEKGTYMITFKTNVDLHLFCSDLLFLNEIQFYS